MSIDRSILEHISGGFENHSFNHVLHLNVNEEDETEGIEQVQVINHSSYYDNDILIPVWLPKTDSFCILITNIESINAKFSELDIFVQTLREQKIEFRAICIQETWLSDKDDYSSVKLKGYKCISRGKRVAQKVVSSFI